ncbi:hypothetical protein MTO96_047235 [Rhipicephalus appendiculatus]
MIAEEVLAAAAALSSLLFRRTPLHEDNDDEFAMALYRAKLERHDRHRVPLYVERVVPTYLGLRVSKVVSALEKHLWSPRGGVPTIRSGGYLVGDAAHPLKMWLLPSYRHTTAKWEPWMTAFKYARTRQRVVIEQAFRI